MINKILMGIFTLIINLINLLLSPIDSLINSSLPAVSDGLNLVNNLINYINNVIAYSLDMLLLNSTTIGLIVSYFSFVLVVPFVVRTIKLVVRWYNALKP